MSVNLDSYKTFYYVAKYRNITHAAKALFQTQPTVSRCIAGLEAELGCRLFVRSKKGVMLTPEAELLYQHISAACQEIFLAEEQLSKHKSFQEGLIRIGASEMTIHHCLLPFLGAFRQKYPGIRIQISSYNTPTAFDALKKGEIDFAVIISPYPQISGYRVTRISTFRDIVIVGKDFSHLCSEKMDFHKLTSYPLVCLQSGTGTRQYLEELFEHFGQELRPEIELPTTDLIVPVVQQNLGIGIVPENFARKALQEKSVFQVHLKQDFPPRQISVVSHQLHPISLAGQQFLQLLMQQMTMDDKKSTPQVELSK